MPKTKLVIYLMAMIMSIVYQREYTVVWSSLLFSGSRLFACFALLLFYDLNV